MSSTPASNSSNITVLPLGAGQDVGRSCIIVRLGGKTIMFDCGLHMAFNDSRRFPDFTHLAPSGPYTAHVDLVLLSHFHLDHSGGLPYFTERAGYAGPVLMTAPTRAIIPVLLEDFRKIVMDGLEHTDPQFFSAADIARCLAKTVVLELDRECEAAPGVFVTAHYAGHVLGAAMFTVRVGNQSVLYTGDFNVTPDRHLGAARVPRLAPDVLITESTYAATTRDSKRFREQEFLSRVKAAVDRGGKVLIPVFALGRAQELCLLLDTFWRRLQWTGVVPIYVSAGLILRANAYYKLFAAWTTEAMRARAGATAAAPFAFPAIEPLTPAAVAGAGPMVVLATPGMLHTGVALNLLTKWCDDERNLVVIPGYCAPGTVGAKLLAGEPRITVDAPKVAKPPPATTTKTNNSSQQAPPQQPQQLVLDIKLEVASLSFSAHADAHGILTLLRQSHPRHVVLVHGERAKMALLRDRVWRELGLPCSCPGNGVSLLVGPAAPDARVRLAAALARGWAVDAATVTARYASEVAAVVAARAALANNASVNANVNANANANADVDADNEVSATHRSKRARLANRVSSGSHSNDSETAALTVAPGVMARVSSAHGHMQASMATTTTASAASAAASGLAAVEAAIAQLEADGNDCDGFVPCSQSQTQSLENATNGSADVPSIALTGCEHLDFFGNHDNGVDSISLTDKRSSLGDVATDDDDNDSNGGDNECGECGDCHLCDARFVPPPPEPVLEAVAVCSHLPDGDGEVKPHMNEAKPHFNNSNVNKNKGKPAAKHSAVGAANIASGAARGTYKANPFLAPGQPWWVLAPSQLAALGAAPVTATLSRDWAVPACWAAAATTRAKSSNSKCQSESASPLLTVERLTFPTLFTRLNAGDRAVLMYTLIAHSIELALWCRLRSAPTGMPASVASPASPHSSSTTLAAEAAAAAEAGATTVADWLELCGPWLTPGACTAALCAVAANASDEVYIDGTSLRLKLVRKTGSVRIDWAVEDELIAQQVEEVARCVLTRRAPTLTVSTIAALQLAHTQTEDT